MNVISGYLHKCRYLGDGWVYEGKKKYLRKKHILLPYKLLLFRSNIRLESKLWWGGMSALFSFFLSFEKRFFGGKRELLLLLLLLLTPSGHSGKQLCRLLNIKSGGPRGVNCKGCGTASGVAVADTTPKRRARKVEVMVMDFMVSE